MRPQVQSQVFLTGSLGIVDSNVLELTGTRTWEGGIGDALPKASPVFGIIRR